MYIICIIKKENIMVVLLVLFVLIALSVVLLKGFDRIAGRDIAHEIKKSQK